MYITHLLVVVVVHEEVLDALLQLVPAARRVLLQWPNTSILNIIIDAIKNTK